MEISADMVADATMTVAVVVAQNAATDVATAEEDVTQEEDLTIAVAEDAIHPDLARLTQDLATRNAIKSHTPTHAEDTRSPVLDLSHAER
jgi:hypothetical protein